jgi:hypothetical protein
LVSAAVRARPVAQRAAFEAQIPTEDPPCTIRVLPGKRRCRRAVFAAALRAPANLSASSAEPHLLPASNARLFRFANRKRRNATRRIFRLPLRENATHRSVSFALVRLTMSVRLPSGRRSRYMRAHFSSGTTECRRVTLRVLVAASAFFVSGACGCAPDSLCKAGGPSDGVLAPLLALQLVFRCAATRHLEPQNRADWRERLEHVAAMSAGHIVITPARAGR